MTLVERLLRRPRSLFLWKLNFHAHLWLSLLLTLYLIFIGVTGSLLVFRVELERLSGLRPWPVKIVNAPRVTIDELIEKLRSIYPQSRILSLTTPTVDDPEFSAALLGPRERSTVKIDPQTGVLRTLLKPRRSWIDTLADLHATFLLGRNGRVANGIGGAIFLLINLSGLVIWWPGVKLWTRGLMVDWRRRWRRINFDLHRALGFWALPLLSVWAISGIYFGWPAKVFSLVDRLSPVVSAQPPVVHVKPVAQMAAPNLSGMIAAARELDPGTTFSSIVFPYSRRAPFEILMRRAGGTGREYTDVLYFSPWDGSHLETWRYGVNQSLGDWFIWLQVPLHFGTYWGLWVKIVWALCGMAIPALAASGALMYWNRVLRHRKPRSV